MYPSDPLKYKKNKKISKHINISVLFRKNSTPTRTKTSIRYAKENHREKRERRRERKKGRRRDIEREGEIRERERKRERGRERERGERDREVKGVERVKGAQSKPNPSPNAFPKLCEWFSSRFLLKGRGTRVPSLRGKSS